MKVLHILAELKPSGAEVMLKSAINEFAKNNIHSDILSTGENIGIYATCLSGVGYNIHHLPFRRNLLFFLKLYIFINKHNYDVIHLHTERANFWIGIISLLSNAPLILRTIHNCFLFNGSLKLIRGAQRRILSKLGILHISISTSVQNNELSRFKLKTFLINNWYDDQSFHLNNDANRKKSRKLYSIDSNNLVIISIGNCSLIKNHSSLIKALSMINEEIRPLYLHVGLEESEMTERALVASLGLEKSIIFLGQLNDIRPALSASDLFVMPSLFEGVGIACLEALAMGLPLLLTDVPGLSDFKDKYPGIYYSSTDTNSLRCAIENIISKKNK